MKNSIKSTVKYIRELSVVVIGIAITFTLNNWINNNNEKRDIVQYLNAVKSELENNLKIVEKNHEFYTETTEFGRLLSNYINDSISKSSKKYNHIISNLFIVNYKTSALEMLKTSGTMRLIKNKALLNLILESYESIENAKQMSDLYMMKKMDELYDVVLNNYSSGISDLTNPKYKRYMYFFTTHLHIENLFEESKNLIKQTLTLF